MQCPLCPKRTFVRRIEHVCFVPIADINHHLFSAVVIALIRLFQFGGPLKSARQRLGMARDSQQPLQLFDLPGGLVVDDIGQAAPDRFVKLHHSVGNRSRDTFIFPVPPIR